MPAPFAENFIQSIQDWEEIKDDENYKRIEEVASAAREDFKAKYSPQGGRSPYESEEEKRSRRLAQNRISADAKKVYVFVLKSGMDRGLACFTRRLQKYIDEAEREALEDEALDEDALTEDEVRAKIKALEEDDTEDEEEEWTVREQIDAEVDRVNKVIPSKLWWNLRIYISIGKTEPIQRNCFRIWWSSYHFRFSGPNLCFPIHSPIKWDFVAQMILLSEMTLCQISM